LQGIPHNFGKFLKEKLIYFLQLGGDNGNKQPKSLILLILPKQSWEKIGNHFAV
jgi:hypothetical protein